MSHGIDECYSVYNETTLKARKAHVCDACERTIERGHYYCRIFIIWQGDKEHVKRCGSCQLTHEHLRKLGGGDTWPDETLSCGLDYEDEWMKAPPPEVQALAFASSAETGELIGPLARLKEWAASGEAWMRRHDYRRYPAVQFARMVRPVMPFVPRGARS